MNTFNAIIAEIIRTFAACRYYFSGFRGFQLYESESDRESDGKSDGESTTCDETNELNKENVEYTTINHTEPSTVIMND